MSDFLYREDYLEGVFTCVIAGSSRVQEEHFRSFDEYPALLWACLALRNWSITMLVNLLQLTLGLGFKINPVWLDGR